MVPPTDRGATGAPAWRRILPALLALITVASLYVVGALGFLDREFAELRFRLLDRKATGNVVVVAIDPASLRELTVWPWPREVHARLIDWLVAADARQIALDIDFSAYSTPAMDAQLEAALREAGGRVIMPVFLQLQPAADGQALVSTEPLPRFARYAQLASVNVRPEKDGLVWRMVSSEQWPDRRVPSLSAALAGPETEAAGSFLVDFSIDPRSIPIFSYADVLQGRVDPALIRGRQVLVGATAAELRDDVPVPVYRSLSGALLHILAYESLVQGRALHKISPIAIVIALVITAVASWAAFVRLSWRGGLLAVGGGCTAVFLASAGLQAVAPVMPDASPFILLLFLLFTTNLVLRVDRQTMRLLLQNLTLRRLDALMRSVVDNSFDGIVTLRDDGRIETANDAAHRIFHYSPGDLIGRGVAEILPTLARANGTLASGLVAGASATVGRRPGGQVFALDLAISETREADQRLWIAILRDATERQAHERQLRHQATHDALTGLPNRVLLQDRLENAVARAKRERRPLALLLLDLDHFKTINDTLGHRLGDLLLRDVGERLLRPLRESDTIARLGGDEFAVVLPAISGAADAELVAQRIVEVFEEPFRVGDLSLEVAISVGIAYFPKHAEDPDALLQCADVAMYQAKQGRWGVATYDADKDENSVRHLTLTGELRQAIEQGQLSFHYQPKLELASGRVCGAEALIRWHHPTHGFIPPDEFIVHAEQTGLIGPLTQWVFDTALRQLVAWQSQGMALRLSVNLSARNLHDAALPDSLNKLTELLNLDRSHICLEITESAIMLDPEGALAVVRRLHDLEFRLSIDDFGTGYSSLAYLKRLPVHELKIDKSFVIHMTENDHDAVIVRSTVDLAHNLGLDVVAEGIESEHHLQILRGLGCDLGQGYFICRPLPDAEATEWFQGKMESPLAGDSKSAGAPLKRRAR